MRSETEEAAVNGASRMIASPMTWPIEKSKLLYQAGSRQMFHDLTTLGWKRHALGMKSSAIQRGGAAFIMFYLQGNIYKMTENATPNFIVNQSLAGALAGALTAPFHCYWEIIKIRGQFPCRPSFSVSLRPMIFRHGVFDGTFFAINAYMSQHKHHYSSSTRFAASAAVASLANLIFDVWKTRQMKFFPKRISLASIVSTMCVNQFSRNFLIKGTDLSINWFIVGCVREQLFGHH